MRRCFSRSCAAWLWLAVAAPAGAATYGLLVGVSSYPALAPERRLQGPRNDVALLKESLVHQGVPASHLDLLADGLTPRLPTRDNILKGMAGLGSRAHAGDWAIIYLSGHGSQQPQRQSDGWREPDGRDEIFLPYDAGRWDGQAGSVRNAIVDDEIGAAMARLLAGGISVWAIFDTCHAGGMSKDWAPDGTLRNWRYVPPQALGVPQLAAAKGARAPRGLLPAPAAAPGEGKLVVFYGAAYDEPAAEEAMPDAGGATVHGVFTWHLVHALETRRHHDYRGLLQAVQQAYSQERRSISTPGAEGELAQCLPFAGTEMNKGTLASDNCRGRASVKW